MARSAKAARQNDTCRGKCDIGLHTAGHNCFHRNEGILQGSCNVFVEGLPAQKVGDEVMFTTCQHMGRGIVDEGSGTVYVNGAAAARVKDGVRCQNTMCNEQMAIMTGASTVFFGD